MVLIDAVYLNSEGGKVLLDYFLTEILKTQTKCVLFLDSRNKEIGLKFQNTITIYPCRPSELSRYFLYKSHIYSISSVFCLANVPPPFFTEKKTHIYFHNYLYLDYADSNMSNFNKIKIATKFRYIKFLNKKAYTWVVQTPNMKNELSKCLGISQSDIDIIPFFSPKKAIRNLKAELNSFIYIASDSPHKNHDRLIQAFIMTAKNSQKAIKLNLTLNELSYKKLISQYTIPKNLTITNLGLIPNDSIVSNLQRSEFLVFPSLKESFGLPLIEACQVGLNIISANLTYARNLMVPSLSFNPYSVKSISESINQALIKKGVKKPKLLINDEIELLIKRIKSYDE